jgi:hypothetical protein
MIETPHNYVRVDMCMANMKWKIHILQLTWLLTLRPSLCEHYLHVIGCKMCWELRHHIFMKSSCDYFFQWVNLQWRTMGYHLDNMMTYLPKNYPRVCMHLSWNYVYCIIVGTHIVLYKVSSQGKQCFQGCDLVVSLSCSKWTLFPFFQW